MSKDTTSQCTNKTVVQLTSAEQAPGEVEKKQQFAKKKSSINHFSLNLCNLYKKINRYLTIIIKQLIGF